MYTDCTTGYNDVAEPDSKFVIGSYFSTTVLTKRGNIEFLIVWKNIFVQDNGKYIWIIDLQQKVTAVLYASHICKTATHIYEG